MTCEQVEELLSAYLDNALASEERREVAAHLRQCSHCNAILADFRRFDALLSQMPRVSPDSSLRERIFSELTGTDDGGATEDSTLPRVPARLSLSDKRNRPQLIAIPGGRSTAPRVSAHSDTQKYKRVSPSKRQRRRGLITTLVAVAAVIAVMLGFGGVIALHPWTQQTQAVDIGAITPPAAQQSGGPLSAGLRYVFLRNESLWSTLADGSSQAERLTPDSVVVSSNWVVSPPLPGRSAGDRIAYIDLQTAYVHTIRSDGQQDTVVKQPLLKAGVVPASIWDTDTGMAILNGLEWSKDGSMLAFVADPTGTGQTRLYIFFTETCMVQMVPITSKGSISHPVWSPDGVRLAFELAANGVVWNYDISPKAHF
jgi:anti-sigma factor RsiW